MSECTDNPESIETSEAQAPNVGTPTKATAAPRVVARRSWPKPATTATVHPVIWLMRVFLVLTEPVRTLARIVRYLLEEPRYASAPLGRVTVRRSVLEGLSTEPLWHPRKRVFGAFAWGGDGDVVDLAHAVLTDYLGGDPPDRLCLAFTRRAFAQVLYANQPWTLTTLQVEQALRLALMEIDTEAGVLAA